jgi:hypothetical protein
MGEQYEGDASVPTEERRTTKSVKFVGAGVVWKRGWDPWVALRRGGATWMQEGDEGDASVPAHPLNLPHPYGLDDRVPTDIPLSEGAANGKLKLMRVPWSALLCAVIVPP